jgi:hypothetical protein
MRTVVRHELFEADAEEILSSSTATADEFLEAVEFVLSRRPESGYQVSPNVWWIPAYTLPLVVYYTFDDTHVYLLSLQRTTLEL